jgi:uncharacterized protein (DUF4415 family)
MEVLAATESQTDWERVDTMTEEALEEAIANDEDWKDIPQDWYHQAELVIPVPKKLFSLRIDADVLEYYRSLGAGYQTRMNAVLRSFMLLEKEHAKAGAAAPPPG